MRLLWSVAASLILLAATLSVPVRADEELDGLIPHLALGAGKMAEDANRVLAIGQSMAADKLKWSVETAAARRAYWAAFPNGQDLPALREAYARALQQKDYFYFFIKSTDLFVDREFGNNHSRFGGIGQLLDTVTLPLDGGIPKINEPYFGAWVARVHDAIAKSQSLSETDLQRALAGAANAYEAYLRHRDVNEFLVNSPTSPARSTDPLQYFEYLELYGKDSFSVARADANYRQLTQVLGKDLVDKAIDTVRRLPRQPDGYYINPKAPGPFGKPAGYYVNGLTQPFDHLDHYLRQAMEASPSDHIYLLAFLGIGEHGPMTLGDLYTALEERYQDVVKLLGEAKVADAAKTIRAGLASARDTDNAEQKKLGYTPDPLSRLNGQYYKMVLEQVPELFSVPLRRQPVAGPVQIAYEFADLGGAAWERICEGSNGSFLGMRYPGPNSRQKRFNAPEVVRLDRATGTITVLAQLTKEFILTHGGDKLSTDVWIGPRKKGQAAVPAEIERERQDAGAPGSIIYRDGWIYGTSGARNRAMIFRMREDGSQAQVLDYHQCDEPPILLGFDTDGNLVMSDRALVTFLEEKTGLTALIQDSRHILGNPDDPVYALTTQHATVDRHGLVFVPAFVKLPEASNASGLRKRVVVTDGLYRIDTKAGDAHLLPGRFDGALITQLTAMNGGFYGLLDYSRSSPTLPLGLMWIDREAGNYRELHRFTVEEDSAWMNHCPFTPGRDGRLYRVGISLYRIDPDGSNFNVLADFSPRTKTPQLGKQVKDLLLAHSDGSVYGIADYGGKNDGGTIFRISPGTDHVTFGKGEEGSGSSPSMAPGKGNPFRPIMTSESVPGR